MGSCNKIEFWSLVNNSCLSKRENNDFHYISSPSYWVLENDSLVWRVQNSTATLLAASPLQVLPMTSAPIAKFPLAPPGSQRRDERSGLTVVPLRRMTRAGTSLRGCHGSCRYPPAPALDSPQWNPLSGQYLAETNRPSPSAGPQQFSLHLLLLRSPCSASEARCTVSF